MKNVWINTIDKDLTQVIDAETGHTLMEFNSKHDAISYIVNETDYELVSKFHAKFVEQTAKAKTAPKAEVKNFSQLVMVEFHNTEPYLYLIKSDKKITVTKVATYFEKNHDFDSEEDSFTFVDEPIEVNL